MDKDELEIKLKELEAKYKTPSFFDKHIISIFFFIMFIAIYLGGVYMHEQAHGAIYNSYGIPVTYGYTWSYAYTKSQSPCPKDTDCELLQNMNEIYSYNLDKFYILISAGLFLIIILLEFLLNEYKTQHKQNHLV